MDPEIETTTETETGPERDERGMGVQYLLGLLLTVALSAVVAPVGAVAGMLAPAGVGILVSLLAVTTLLIPITFGVWARWAWNRKEIGRRLGLCVLAYVPAVIAVVPILT